MRRGILTDSFYPAAQSKKREDMLKKQGIDLDNETVAGYERTVRKKRDNQASDMDVDGDAEASAQVRLLVIAILPVSFPVHKCDLVQCHSVRPRLSGWRPKKSNQLLMKEALNSLLWRVTGTKKATSSRAEG